MERYNLNIFKAYDIRGIYPDELNKEVAYKLGRAIGRFFREDIVVAQDVRLSSPILFRALAQGINDEGFNVIDIGICSTPMLYFGVNHLNAKAGVMITASHNPKNYNGFKLTREKAIPISFDTGIKKIREHFLKGFSGKGNGKIIKKDIFRAYIDHILSFAKDIKKLKLVVDASNGVAGKEVNEVFKHLDSKLIPLYFEPDGNFPNHEPNPLIKENVKSLQQEVIKNRADLGVVFDGDADRVIFISNKGEIIQPDFITCLIAKHILKQNKAPILYDLRSSWIVKETIEANGGKAIMVRVGHAFIKNEMRKYDASFGGELSGHYYFKENFYADSGIIALIIMMNLISEENKSISELIEPLKRYYKSEEINFKVNNKEAKIKELAKIYANGNISYLDGIRVEFEDWWFNVRPSNTEPLLRLNLEAKTKELLEIKLKELMKIIKE